MAPLADPALKALTLFRALLFVAGSLAWMLAAAMAVSGRLLWALLFAAFAFGAHIAGRAWSRAAPVAFPHYMRWLLYLPRGPHSAQRVRRVLQPLRGERILEIGPGVGIHALPIASSLAPGGVLDLLDVQREMLDALMRGAARRGLTNVVPSQGDARRLPYADHVFDAAYLIGVLGEIPDGVAALRELHRVLKPGGRLLIAELAIDPDFVALGILRAMAGDAGFVLDRTVGPRLAYCAVLRPG
ncbi:MAG: methyltransferase domain-containing protein [Gemmatimonadota bacterium]